MLIGTTVHAPLPCCSSSMLLNPCSLSSLSASRHGDILSPSGTHMHTHATISIDVCTHELRQPPPNALSAQLCMPRPKRQPCSPPCRPTGCLQVQPSILPALASAAPMRVPLAVRLSYRRQPSATCLAPPPAFRMSLTMQLSLLPLANMSGLLSQLAPMPYAACHASHSQSHAPAVHAAPAVAPLRPRVSTCLLTSPHLPAASTMCVCGR